MRRHGNIPLRLIGLLIALAAPHVAWAQNAQWGIWVMKPDGSQARLLAQVENATRHGRPRWSHDGKQIVFDVDASSGAMLSYVVSADGSGLRQIGEFGYPGWSPDDKQLVFQSLGRTNIENLDGSGRTHVAVGGSPCLSPDGSQLAVSYRDNVYVTNLLTGEAKALFARPKEQIYYGFAWFPDGKRLAVVARPERRKPRELLYVSADGEEQGVQVRLTGEMAGFISFSPDGKRLALDSSYKVQLLEVDGTSPLVLPMGQTGANRDPDWSPDGEWIVFASSRDAK